MLLKSVLRRNCIMKEVLCNVLYHPTLPIMYKKHGQITHSFGYFVDQKDAIIASNIQIEILTASSEPLGVLYIGSSGISEMLIPKEKMHH